LLPLKEKKILTDPNQTNQKKKIGKLFGDSRWQFADSSELPMELPQT
jgi:hypothetical protein